MDSFLEKQTGAMRIAGLKQIFPFKNLEERQTAV